MAAPAQARGPGTTAQPAAPAKTAGPPAKPAPSQPAAKPAQAAAKPVDGGWPRAYTTASGGRVVVYQPQVASWENQKHMVAYAAVSLRAEGRDEAGPRHHQDRGRHEGRGRRSGS